MQTDITWQSLTTFLYRDYATFAGKSDTWKNKLYEKDKLKKKNEKSFNSINASLT